MNSSQSILWIIVASLILVLGLVFIYNILPPENRVVIGTASLSLKGLFGTGLIFISVWLVMFKLKTARDTKSLILLAMKAVFAIILGEFLYQTGKQYFYANSFSLIEVIRHSWISVIIGFLFAILIAFYFKTGKPGKTIGIGFLLWIVIGMIIRHLGFGA